MAGRAIVLSGILILLTAAVSDCSEDPITIGVSLSLTGKYAAMGKMQKNGFELWESHINSRNGILGREVKMRIIDDRSAPDAAAAIYTQLIEKEKVDLVFGPYSSGISEAVLPVTEKHGYPVLVSGASADKLWKQGYKYAFGVYTPASKYIVGFLQLLVHHKLKTIAIVSADDAFSLSISEGAMKWAERFRLKTAMVETFKKGRKDLSLLAKAAKDSGAESLIVCGHLNESVNMRAALKSVGWRPGAYYSSVGPATDQFYGILGDDANFTFSSSQWEESVGKHFPGGDQFISSFKMIYGQSPTYHAATAYAAGMILEAALTKTGSLDKKRLRDTLSVMDTMTVIGRYGVDNYGFQVRHFPLIIQWLNNEKKVVWPEKLKQTDPVFHK